MTEISVFPNWYVYHAIRYMKQNHLQFRCVHWRGVRGGKAPITWEEALVMAEDYRHLFSPSLPFLPCVMLSPLTHEEMHDYLKQFNVGW